MTVVPVLAEYDQVQFFQFHLFQLRTTILLQHHIWPSPVVGILVVAAVVGIMVGVVVVSDCGSIL